MNTRIDDTTSDITLMMWEADPETLQFTYVSRGAERMLGYSIDGWLRQQMTWADLLHPDDRDRAVQLCRAAIATCQDQQLEYRVVAAGGQELRVRDLIRVICDARRTPTMVRGVMLGMSLPKPVLPVADAGNRYYRAIVEQTLDLVTVVSADGVILYESPSAARILGLEGAARCGRRIFERVHPDDLTGAWRVFHQAFSTGEPSPVVELRCRHADGSWRTLEVVGRPVRIDNGPPVGILNSRDITGRKHLELRLREAEKLEAIGRLSGQIAHDFSNVVSAIHGNAEFALAHSMPEDATRSVEDIRHAAEIGLRLTRQLLSFSRGSDPSIELIDVNDEIRKMTPLLVRLVEPGISLELNISAETAPVLLGPGMIEEVVMNLALNARDAMPRGGRLTISTQSVPDEKSAPCSAGRFVLEVTDTGDGIGPEVRSRIFEPFFTTKDAGKGIGLGLPTVYRIVKSAGGDIEVMSEVGTGTRFVVTLPLTRE